ncbi:hypothetical protein SCALM49S_06246 [Streptomyces californicus]
MIRQARSSSPASRAAWAASARFSRSADSQRIASARSAKSRTAAGRRKPSGSTKQGSPPGSAVSAAASAVAMPWSRTPTRASRAAAGSRPRA